MTINNLQLTIDKIKKIGWSHVNPLPAEALAKVGQMSPKAPGQMVIVALIFLTVTLILTGALFGRTAGFLRLGANSLRQEQAINIAEAGIAKALWQLNETAGSYPGETNTSFGEGFFTTSVTDQGQNLKTITSTGYLVSVGNPRSKQTIKVDVLVDSTTISFRYAVEIGAGGVTMANSSTIHGNVYSNGNIAGLNSSTIEGDAYAVGTITSPAPFVTGTKYPGASPTVMPTVDYQFWRDAANVNNDPVTCAPLPCTILSDGNLGPKKYIGNLTITNNAAITLKGPVHVTGNFTISQGGTTIKLDDSFGSNGTVMIVDGVINYTQGGSFQPTNATPPGYIMVITTSTANPAVAISQSGATAVFYALEGGASLSQTADVTSIIANRLNMTQSAQLTFDTGLASAQFSTGPGASWQVKKGTYRFTSSP